MLVEAETLKVRMAETEKTMALITKKVMEPGTGDDYQGPWYLPAASWTTSERYSKKHIYKSQ